MNFTDEKYESWILKLIADIKQFYSMQQKGNTQSLISKRTCKVQRGRHCERGIKGNQS